MSLVAVHSLLIDSNTFDFELSISALKAFDISCYYDDDSDDDSDDEYDDSDLDDESDDDSDSDEED